MKMHDSMACVDACVSRDHAEQLMMGSLIDPPILIITCGQSGGVEMTWTYVVLWAGHLGRVRGE